MDDTLNSQFSAGLGGFLAFFVLALCLWLLMRNMTSRMHRMAFEERRRSEAADAELAAHDARRDQIKAAQAEGRAAIQAAKTQAKSMDAEAGRAHVHAVAQQAKEAVARAKAAPVPAAPTVPSGSAEAATPGEASEPPTSV